MKLGNTVTRILVSITAIPLLLAVFYFGKIYFLLFGLIVGLFSYYEFAKMNLNKLHYVSRTIGFPAVAAIILNSYYHFIGYYHLSILIVLCLALIELFRNKESAIQNIGSSLFGIMYLGFLSSTLIGLREYFTGTEYVVGGYLIISILVTIWVCDSAAFFVGTSIGKHKLFPRVSPKKSWEGAVAGFIFSIATMLLAKFIALDVLNWIDAIALGIIVGIFGQIGDLIESLIKRDAGVKDSSSIIPGHGGIFDRFDSLLYSAPIIFLYFEFLR